MENSIPNPKLAQAVEALQKMRQKLEKVESARHEPIAIIGMACRFPGADSPEVFWDLLQRGEDRVREVPSERWNVDEHYDPIPGTPGKTYLREVALLDKVDEFDPQFFGISPREAERMDPQQRLLLEVAWEALERAGQQPQAIRNSKAGVFVGVSGSEYISLMDDAERTDTYSSLGNCVIFASGRLSYVLGLQGPSMVVDTACSASLLGVHLASESLRNRTSDLALAGGVHLLLSPQGNIAMSQMQAVAPDGRCKTFDAAANGFGRGEGCGIVVLKRLSDAQAAGDPILALVRGSATNHDGPSSGLTVPSATAQAALIRAALADGKVLAGEVMYVEAHGTGTTLGDPIEVRALETVFSPRQEPLLVGSVKTNIGHLEEAAGIAGLMKVVLSMQKGEIPPHLHFRNPNPHINWDNTAIRVAAQGAPWPAGKKIAGVSSFGMGGSNAHVVLEEAPPTQPAAKQAANETERPLHLLTISAKSGAGLHAYAGRYAGFLAAEPTLDLGDVCYSAAVGRNHFLQRLAVVGASAQETQAQLAAFAANEVASGVVSGAAGQHVPSVAFLFTGQGSQSVGMGRDLYETQPVFRAALDRCAQLFAAELQRPLLAVMFGQETDKTLLDDTAYTQPALFALEYALAELWQSWGVRPSAAVGHSIGEYAAACIAGVMSLEDAVRLVAARGRLMSALPQDGEMVSLQAGETRVRMALAPFAADVSIAAVNGPASVVIAGRREPVQAIAQQFAAEGVKTQRLAVSHAFHSPLMEPMLDAFRQVAASVTYRKPTLRLISNVTGKVAGDEITKPEYWVRHVRNTVRFADGVAALHEQNIGVFLEIGPKPVLLGMAGQMAADREPVAMLPSLRAGQSDWQQMLLSLGELWVRGVEVDWVSFDGPYSRRKVVLPTYPFQRQRYWIDAPKRKQTAAVRPLIDKATRLPLHGETVYEAEFSVEALPFLGDHRVYGEVVSPAACQVAMALNAAELSLRKQKTLALEDVVLPQALVIPAQQARTVQAVFRKSAAPDQTAGSHSVRREFQIVSFFEGEGAQDAAIVADGNGEAADQTPVHATGYAAVSAAEPPAAVDLADLRRRFVDAVDAASLYAAGAGAQIELGPSFRWLAEAWRGGEEAAPEALARLVRPAAVGSLAGYLLHPGLLDACFQVAGLTCQTQDETLLPFALAAVRIHQPTQGEVWWCHAVQTAAHKWDIQLLDEQGQVIAAIEGFHVRPAPASAIHGDDLWRKWLYTVQWQPVALEPQPAAAQMSANAGGGAELAGQGWIVFADRQGFGAALAQQLREHGARALEVYAGEGWRQVDEDRIEIAPGQAEDYRRLVAACSPVQGVVHLWGVGSAAGGGQPLVQGMRQGCESALLLVQSLLHEQAALIGLWLVTQDAQAVAAEDCVSGVAQAGLWGMGRVLALEHPELNPVCVDLPRAGEVTGDVTGDVTVEALRLCAEVLAHIAQAAPLVRAERQIALRQGVRYAPRLGRFAPPSPAELSCRPDATYLVTGGLGGLGLAVAERLAQAGARQLVLMGRSAPKPEAQARLDALAVQGVRVTVAQADVSDRRQLQAVLDQIDESCPLAGVVHSAGVLDDGALLQQSWDRFTKVLAPKAQGAWNLHTATAEMTLDFFVLFSSAAALLGNRGQSNYVAANAFLDALAHHRRSQGLPALSIDWGAWAEVGMAAAMMRDGRTQLAAQGADSIAPAQGLDAFAHLLTQQAAQVAVFAIDWARWQAFYPAEALDPMLFNLVAASQPTERTKGQVTQAILVAAAGQERKDLLHTYLAQQVVRILRMAAGELNMHEPLTFLGLDSLMALELKNRIASDLQLNIPVVQLLEGCSVSDLQERLLAQLENLQAAASAQPASPEGQVPSADTGADGQDALAMLQQLDEMSEEGIDQLLQRLLAEEGSL